MNSWWPPPQSFKGIGRSRKGGSEGVRSTVGKMVDCHWRRIQVLVEEEFEVGEIGNRHPTSHQAGERVNGAEKARRSAVLLVQVNAALYFH